MRSSTRISSVNNGTVYANFLLETEHSTHWSARRYPRSARLESDRKRHGVRGIRYYDPVSHRNITVHIIKDINESGVVSQVFANDRSIDGKFKLSEGDEKFKRKINVHAALAKKSHETQVAFYKLLRETPNWASDLFIRSCVRRSSCTLRSHNRIFRHAITFSSDRREYCSVWNAQNVKPASRPLRNAF